MKRRLVLWSGFGAVAVLMAVGGAWILSLPAAPDVAAASPITKEEADATIAALKPPKRQRPLIAIIGVNDGTEATDYLMPYGILRRADVADVVTLGTEPGLVTLYPALKVGPQATVAEFDERHPEGADHVIVPAMRRDDDPAVLQWIRSQAAKGAIIIGVCAGAKVVGNAGLLDGKRATTHWYFLADLRDKHPRYGTSRTVGWWSTRALRQRRGSLRRLRPHRVLEPIPIGKIQSRIVERYGCIAAGVFFNVEDCLP